MPRRAGRSRQKKHGGGKFLSEAQRKFMWAVVPGAAKRWAHNLPTSKGNWRGAGRSRASRRRRKR
jgi:hypothetical protein